MSTASCVCKPARWSHVAREWWRETGKAWQIALQRLRDPYRPELHYMRGPGPKCREKALACSPPSD